jgi:hypothetical protein
MHIKLKFTTALILPIFLRRYTMAGIEPGSSALQAALMTTMLHRHGISGIFLLGKMPHMANGGNEMRFRLRMEWTIPEKCSIQLNYILTGRCSSVTR